MSNSTKQKILIVDDEPDILELIEYNLKKEGYQVFLARNGQEAVAEAKRSLPDLIVLDIMMPKMDGIEACRIMRTMPEFKNTFMVFLTARSEEYSEIAGFNVWCQNDLHGCQANKAKGVGEPHQCDITQKCSCPKI